MGGAPLVLKRKVLNTVEPAKKLPCGTQDQCYGDSSTPTGTKPCKPHQLQQCKTAGEKLLSSELISWGFEPPEKKQEGGRKESTKVENYDANSSKVAVTSPVIAKQVSTQYDTLCLLGEGRYSKVLQVQCKTTQMQYALKAIEKFPMEGGNCYEMEVGVLSRCRHPNVVALHDVVYARDKVYLVLELAAGGDLCSRIASRGHYTESGGRKVLGMILDGLSYLHRNGITHRDMKLENLLCKTQRDDSPVLITDFGLAHIQPTAGGCGQKGSHPVNSDCMSTTCGTAEYMSPEMLWGEEYCSKVDVWAVGVVAYVVLSGEMPFEERTERGGRARLYQLIMKGQYSFSAKVWWEGDPAGDKNFG